MNNSRWMLRLLGLVLMFAIAASSSDTPGLKFTFTNIDVPGAYVTQPTAINNAGVTVGTYSDVYGLTTAYILDGKRVTSLAPQGSASGYTTASGINPDGAVSVVGTYATAWGLAVGYLYKDGKYTDISDPSGVRDTFAFGINDSGAIVGYYLDNATNVAHGFLLQDKKYTTLDVPGGSASGAFAINKSGKIVLNWKNSSGHFEASLYDGKTYKTINVPGAVDSWAEGIDAAGDVTYQWDDAAGVFHGALLHGGKYYKFNHPGSTGTWGGGINDKGNVVGWYATQIHPGVGFKATYQ